MAASITNLVTTATYNSVKTGSQY